MTAAGPMCHEQLTIGAWVDDAFGRIDAEYAARFREAGLTEAGLMVNRMNATVGSPAWELREKPATIARAAYRLRDAGVAIILTCWPRPDRHQLARLESDMRALVEAIDPEAIEVDCEANWHRRHLRDFRTMAEASAELVAVLRRLAGGKRRVELTTYTYHQENGPGALVAPHVDLLLPQAYSVTDRAGEAVPWGSELGPGRMQDLTLERAAQTGAPASALTACGLAAYEQRWPGVRPEVAMQTALDAARSRGVNRVRYWSSKWIVGALAAKQPWAARFTRAAAGAAAR